MRKSSILGRIASNYKRKATNAATQGLYEMMWGEEAPKKKRRVKVKKDKEDW